MAILLNLVNCLHNSLLYAWFMSDCVFFVVCCFHKLGPPVRFSLSKFSDLVLLLSVLQSPPFVASLHPSFGLPLVRHSSSSISFHLIFYTASFQRRHFQLSFPRLFLISIILHLTSATTSGRLSAHIIYPANVCQTCQQWIGSILVLCDAFSWKFDPHPPPRHTNNIGLSTFVTLFFPRKLTPPLQHKLQGISN